MEISVENTGTLGRKLTVQVPADEIDTKVEGRIREMGQRVRLKGFRPGRVPFKVLQQRYGRQVRREVVGELIQESFQRAVSENNLRPASSPKISTEGDEHQGDLQYVAAFDVYPELEKLDVSKLTIAKPVAEVSDKDVDQMIDTLREQRRSWADKQGKAAEHDLVFFRYTVELPDGRFPAQEEDSRAGAILGHGAFDADFEAALVGTRAGEDKQFDITFGEQAREQALAGKSGKVTVKVEKVQESRLPDVDDAFAESFGVSEGGVEQFRVEVRRNLERELKQATSRRLRENVIEKLIDTFSDIEIPAGMVEQEMAELRRQAQTHLQRVGGDPEQAPELESFRERAERRVRGGLLISEVARHAKLQIDMGRVRDKVNEIASTYEDPQSVAAMYYQREDLLSGLQNLVLEEQTVEWVAEQAKVKEAKQSFSELMNPEAAKQS